MQWIVRMKDPRAKDILTRYLKDKKLRITQERRLLLEEIMKLNRHFDADELYDLFRRRGLKASRATVYNTLDLLVESGLISKYTFGENRARYERAFGRQPHDHLICLECGNITEFVNDELGRIEHEVSSEHGFASQSATFQIFGVCKECRLSRRS